MKAKNRKRTGLLFGSVFLAVIIGYAVLGIEVHQWNQQEIKITIKEGISNGAVDISINTSKEWDDVDEQGNAIKGAQYDGVIQNRGKLNLRDWVMTINLPEEGVVDSLWNGQYEAVGDTIVITPETYNQIIKSMNPETFGFVLKSKQVLNIDSFSICGYYVYHYKETLAFWILSVISGIWVLALIIYLMMRAQSTRYMKQKKRDEELIRQSMSTLTSFIDARDPYANGHSQRVAEYSKELARRLNLSEEDIQNCYYIALLHDSGKIGIPDQILNKPEKLTPQERKTMEKHALLGAEILTDFTAIPGIQEGALHHHEHYDGSGYPSGLKGEEISLIARIICVADSFDVMNSDRCYRKHLSREEIIEELVKNKGKQFDPAIVPHMIDMICEGFVKLDDE